MNPRGVAEAGRYLRTIRHLKAAQIAHRVRLRVQQEALRRWPAPFEARWTRAVGRSGWPQVFTAVDMVVPPECGSVEELEQGTFTFLGETRRLGSPVAWDPTDASQLWLYHLHYWEWAWTLAVDSDRDRARSVFADQFTSWLGATSFGRWNAWAPYPTSLRAWVFVNVENDLVSGSGIERAFDEQLGLHVGFIEHNLELDVGGNHLLKNLKALVGLGVRTSDERLLDKAARHLSKQLKVQVLPDGGHFELSPSYHCQVLVDLIDIEGILRSAGWPIPDDLPSCIRRMRRWLGIMCMPDGDVPVFNDCDRVGLGRLAALEPAEAPDKASIVLPDSGYVVAKPGERVHLVADVGQPCPPELPAHAHADCLSFELAIDGSRIVVDPGTSEYGSGPQRRWERSTCAHNTITIDHVDQTEVWGSFRAGRRAKATLHHVEGTPGRVEIVASHSGYEHRPGAPVHRRHWEVSENEVEIFDRIEGSGAHEIRWRLLCDPTQVPLDAATLWASRGHGSFNDRFSIKGPVVSSAKADDPGVERSAAAAEYATGFGQRHPATELLMAGTMTLPVEIRTTISLVDSASQNDVHRREIERSAKGCSD